jgi:hypothetical protein
MKISMTFTLDVDGDAWLHEYGGHRAELREDVRSYFLTLLQGSYPSTEELVRSVELRN